MVEVDDSAIASVEANRGEVESARVGLESMAPHERMRGSDDAPLLRRAGHGQGLGQGRAAPSPAFDFKEHHRVQFHENGIDFMTAPAPVRRQKLPRRRCQGLNGPCLSVSAGLGAAFQNHGSSVAHNAIPATMGSSVPIGNSGTSSWVRTQRKIKSEVPITVVPSRISTR